MERLQYVDVFRGLAILIMIFFHFINAFAPVDVYADFPYFIKSLGIFTFPPPPFLFLFVAGMSSFLLVTKRREQGFRGLAIVEQVVKRYGFYILISLPFAWFVFGLDTWLSWEEALQGIGLTIIVLAIIYVIREIDVYEGIILIAVSALLQANRHVLFNQITHALPATHMPLVNAAGMLIWNASFGGFFAVTNLLPFAIGGLIMIKMLYEEHKPRNTLLLGVFLTAVAAVLILMGYSMRFYARDIPLGFYGAGTAMIIYYVVYRIWHRYEDARIFDVLSTFGQMAFLVYIWSWIFIIKTVEVTGVAGTIPQAYAYGLSFIVTAVIVWASLRYDAFRTVNGPLLLYVKNRVR